MSELITPDLVALDARFGDSKADVITSLAGLVADSGRSADPAGLADDAFAREAKSSTGMPGGLAIPHCRSEHVTESTLAFARLAPPVDFGSKDGPADLVFLIAAPASRDQEHMRLLTKLARALVRKAFIDALRSATSQDEVVRLVSDVISDQPAAKVEPAAVTTTAPGEAPASGGSAATSGSTVQAGADTASSGDASVGATMPGGAVAAGGVAAAAPPVDTTHAPGQPAASSTPSGGEMTIVAVTACPTGIAHTYMAAEALEAAGRKAGVNVVVEPQGSVGAETVDPRRDRSRERCHLRDRRRRAESRAVRGQAGDLHRSQAGHPRSRLARGPRGRGGQRSQRLAGVR